MQTKINSRPLMIWILIWLHILLALGALLGGGAFLLAPDGHLIQMPASHLKNTPFPDFFIPGLILFTFLGIYPLGVAYSLWKQPAWRWPDTINPFKTFHWSWAGSLAAGAIVLIWIVVEMVMIQPGVIHFVYLGWGILLLGITLLPEVRLYCRLIP